VANAALLVFIVADKLTDQTCVEGGYYHKHTPLCYVQGSTSAKSALGFLPCFLNSPMRGCVTALSLASYMWFSCWQACIAVNIWLTVVLQAKKQLMEQVRAAFVPASTVLTILAPVVCLAGHNVGYDWAGYSGTSAIFWARPVLCSF
jgi:hypothetical protein